MSSFKKKKWYNEGEFRIEEGFIYIINVAGQVISQDSKIYKIRFENDSTRMLNIHGNCKICINEDKISEFELNAEMNEYFNDLIQSEEVEFARFDKRGNLEIQIRTEPIISIEMNVGTDVLFGEEWEYIYKDGHVIF